MTTKFKILFMIELQNDYYSNLQCSDFDIIPSQESVKLMKSQRMIFKIADNKLFVLLKVNADGVDKDKPFIAIKTEDKFLFYLILNKPQFKTFTNLDDDNLHERKRYYFSNLYQNDLDGELSLTRKIVQEIGAASYKPGYFTADAGGNVYECLKSTTELNNPPNISFWHDRGKQQYVSAKDMIPVKTRVENFSVSVPAMEFNVRVFALNPVNNQYDKEIRVKEKTITTDENTTEVQVKLTELVAGKYKVKINTDEFELFIDDRAVYNNVFGIIEIFSNQPPGSSFAFLDNNGKVKDIISGSTPVWHKYKIRFANRLAYWKYVTPKHGVIAIDGSPDYSFLPTPAVPGDKEFFTSSKPIPLLESSWKFKINVQSLSNDEDPFAPNPDPNNPGILSRTTVEKDYYCTINLNY